MLECSDLYGPGLFGIIILVLILAGRIFLCVLDIFVAQHRFYERLYGLNINLLLIDLFLQCWSFRYGAKFLLQRKVFTVS